MNTSSIETPAPISVGRPAITHLHLQKRQLKADRLTLFFDDDGTLATRLLGAALSKRRWLDALALSPR